MRPARLPQDAAVRSQRAVRAVFDSGHPRAQVYRRAHGLPTTSAPPSTSSRWSSVTRATCSRDGRLLHARPSTGESGVYGEFLVNAQEDVVAGIRTPEPLEQMEGRCPRRFEQLTETMRRLEEHYKDMQDIEFTVEDGTLYLLQTRTAKWGRGAALKAAVTMVDEA